MASPFLQTPNVGMLTLGEPRPSRPPCGAAPSLTNAPTSHTHVDTWRTRLSEHALRLHNMVPPSEISEWVGVNSQLFVVPFTRSARVTLEFTTHPPDRPLQAPKEQRSQSQWPLNAIVDWAWGSRIGQAFGTKGLRNFARQSRRLSRDIELYRRYLKNRAPEEFQEYSLSVDYHQEESRSTANLVIQKREIQGKNSCNFLPPRDSLRSRCSDVLSHMKINPPPFKWRGAQSADLQVGVWSARGAVLWVCTTSTLETFADIPTPIQRSAWRFRSMGKRTQACDAACEDRGRAYRKTATLLITNTFSRSRLELFSSECAERGSLMRARVRIVDLYAGEENLLCV